ncbi:response regulator [Spongisporangium articulatum]|uniref:Response regulator n=1 Tax=Spongisporangium articulatum TaxID=3362603 RepID=A0ABW8AL18_9ACTN
MRHTSIPGSPLRLMTKILLEHGGVNSSGEEPPIRVVIVDDHQMFSQSLAAVLEAEPNITVAASASSVGQARGIIEAVRPDVVLLDDRLPDGRGTELVKELTDRYLDLSVVMLTASTSEQVLVASIEAGARGYVDKSRNVDEVVAAVRHAATGGAVVSPTMMARLLPQLRRSESSGSERLTAREREILNLLAEGLTNAEIAERLVVSVHTIRNHVLNLSAKLGAHSKLEALSIGLRMGLVDAGVGDHD